MGEEMMDGVNFIDTMVMFKKGTARKNIFMCQYNILYKTKIYWLLDYGLKSKYKWNNQFSCVPWNDLDCSMEDSTRR